MNKHEEGKSAISEGLWFNLLFEVTDDSGFIGILNPASYESFVDGKWELEQLFDHFIEEIRKNNLLLWGTGLEAMWQVEVRNKISQEKGFREIQGFINVTASTLCLTSYDSLTMGAQFPDVKLPEDHDKDLLIPFNNGLYTCRIVQMYDPEGNSEPFLKTPYAFILEFERVSTGENNWDKIPWYDYGRYGGPFHKSYSS